MSDRRLLRSRRPTAPDDHLVVIAGAAPLPDHVVARIPSTAIVLAVDAGLDHARAAGLGPSGLIGDLDSVSDAGLAWAEEHAVIQRHDPAKDQTDTELALAFAADMNPARLTLVGGGDRLDHTVVAIGALGAPSLTAIPRVDGWWNGQHVEILHGPDRRRLELEPASTFSLVALHGRCRGVTLTGARWRLDDAAVDPVAGLGLSNEVVDAVGDVEVAVTDGVLTVFDRPRLDPPRATDRRLDEPAVDAPTTRPPSSGDLP